jgi:acetoacetyl-CoA reductase
MRVALVTGGLGGLGDCISTKLHEAGCKVAVTHAPGNAKVAGMLGAQKSTGVGLNAFK